VERIARLTVAMVVLTAVWLFGQGGDERSSLQQALNSQFALTTITQDRSDIVTAGVVLALQKPGLVMYSTAAPVPPLNTYKNGKISQGMSGFGRDVLGTVLTPGRGTTSDYPHRTFAPGEKLWVTRFVIQKDGIAFVLYSDAYDGIRYYGELKFLFDKNSVPTADRALAMIAEVLTAQPAENSIEATKVPAQMQDVAGLYVMAQAKNNVLQLNADGTLSLVQAGRTYMGTFTIEGSQITMFVGPRKTRSTGILQGDTMTDPKGSIWERQKAAVERGRVLPQVASIRLPSTYVSAQAQADQLQLNADNSFSLQEGGQTYRGTFVPTGNTLETNISDTSTQTTVTI
jgi:hypothetical protein